MPELWDIYDEFGIRTGRTLPRSRFKELRDGEYMLAVHIYIRGGDGRWLIQRRSDTKDTLPGIWDITGGAALSGEESREAALREVGEELGISLRPEQLRLQCRLKRRHSLVDLWLAEADFALGDCVLQEEEVADVRWVDSRELLELVQNADYRDRHDEYAAAVADFVK